MAGIVKGIRLQLATFLSKISCLQVRAPYHLCVLSPSFIVT